MMALGYYGIGNVIKANKLITEVYEMDNNHQGITAFLTMIKLKLK